MLFVKSDGTYIEINRSHYNSDKNYYRTITKARGHDISSTLNYTNDKLANIVKHK
jgi:hypothetical protein